MTEPHFYSHHPSIPHLWTPTDFSQQIARCVVDVDIGSPTQDGNSAFPSAGPQGQCLTPSDFFSILWDMTAEKEEKGGVINCIGPSAVSQCPGMWSNVVVGIFVRTDGFQRKQTALLSVGGPRLISQRTELNKTLTSPKKGNFVSMLSSDLNGNAVSTMRFLPSATADVRLASRFLVVQFLSVCARPIGCFSETPGRAGRGEGSHSSATSAQATHHFPHSRGAWGRHVQNYMHNICVPVTREFLGGDPDGGRVVGRHTHFLSGQSWNYNEITERAT